MKSARQIRKENPASAWKRTPLPETQRLTSETDNSVFYPFIEKKSSVIQTGLKRKICNKETLVKE